MTAGLAIAGAAALAIPSIGSATSSSIALACDKATVTYSTFGPPPQALATYAITVDGAPFRSGTLAPAGPLSVFDVPLGLTGTHVVSASTQGTPVNAFSSASATVVCPVPVTPTPPGTTPVPVGGPVEALPRLVTLPKAQRPRCALPKGAGRNWYIKRGCAIPRRFLAKPRAWAVTGERRAQSPSPATIVSKLLAMVPALAGDVAYASSIRQSAGGREANGGVSSKEMGRLVPLPVPGHPWTSVTRGPKRTVATSASFVSGRLRVSIVYAARAGRSDTSVAVRPR